MFLKGKTRYVFHTQYVAFGNEKKVRIYHLSFFICNLYFFCKKILYWHFFGEKNSKKIQKRYKFNRFFAKKGFIV